MRRRPRGSGTIRRVGSSWAVITGPRARPKYEGGFRTKAEAENRLTLLRAEAMNQRLGVAADPRLTPPLAELAKDWLQRRAETHAAGKEDASRWRKHLAPWFGHLRPGEVDTARLRAFVEAKRGEIKPGTIRVTLAVLSSLFEDLLERGVARSNPARHMPKSLLRLIRPDHDPRTTPFMEKLEDVRRLYLALHDKGESIAVAYALGALAGLRTGEVFALRWASVDLAGRRLLVSESTRGQTKDRDPRPVPILDPLVPVLEAWRLKTGGTGLVIPPLRCDGEKIDKSTPGNMLRPALKGLGLEREGLGWYEATRHTFASQWAMAGRPLRELQAILGHSSIAVTERYAHLAPGFWAPGVHSALAVDLAPGTGSVADISVQSGRPARTSSRKYKRKAGVVL